MAQNFDAMVLGGGIVGISTTLHLQQRGLSVVLVDRREPGHETSFGNAGLIESSSILPHPFPKGLSTFLALAGNRTNAVHSHYGFVLRNLPWFYAYWRASRGPSLDRIGSAYRSLTGAALPEHHKLAKLADATGFLRDGGWLELCRSDAELAEADGAAEAARQHGIRAVKLDRASLRRTEPALQADFAGAIHWTDTTRIVDPGGFMARLLTCYRENGGIVATGDALQLRQFGDTWQLPIPDGRTLRATHAVATLGPWSAALAERLGYRFPLLGKRGYHQHFDVPQTGDRLTHPIYIRDANCLIVPMAQGTRVMTGIELAAPDAPPGLVQMKRMVAAAHAAIKLGPSLDAQPWLGSRPCMPDMLPVIGPAPRHNRLWFAFGHGHAGLTLGPLTGRLIAELITGDTPFIPLASFSPARFDTSRRAFAKDHAHA